ncbi:probable arabinosyltransferase ARAD1 [Andrographis paniculata]|uniref:probable arabinosyltransferase ARAD1 n=1 Tax=Andrographis paniculata TaxID=175694 RepID=UPI0021E97793|nr:probable arabinosyltransferase ARAD1 [Andrographis paniculata]
MSSSSSAVSDKPRLPSKPLSCLITFSIFLLISSSFSLLQLSRTSSFLRLIVPPRTSSQNPSINLRSEHGRIKDVRTSCNDEQPLLRVYIYDLPPDFHFKLLGWIPNGDETWPDVSDPNRIPTYPGGLNQQHSVEYWLLLDLLSSEIANVLRIRPCTAIRVLNSSESDIVFVPFFASLSYNRHSKIQDNQKLSLDRQLQRRLVEFLNDRIEWKKGRNHLIVAHHPNSMMFARNMIGSSATFVLADFGRYPSHIANMEKDVIAPYKHMVQSVSAANSAPFDKRPTLIYFQGAIYRKDGGAIRQELYYLLKDENDVHFSFGSVQANGVREAGEGMASSKFCLTIAGDTPSSNRLFDAIVSHCVPVIISDDIELPFEDILDYSEFCVFVRASDAVEKGYLVKLLRGIARKKWTKMWERLKEVSRHFEYQYPSRRNDAVDMIWQSIARKAKSKSKLKSTQLFIHRKNRYRSKNL